jgi:hypothetical protein
MFWKRSLLLIVVLTATGCATTHPPYNPYKIPEAEFHGRIHTIALSPMMLPDGLVEPEKVKEKLESLIDAKLRGLGFTVVPSREYAAVWKQMAGQLGGYFDSVTGKRDETKYKAVRTHSLREMNTKFKADAVLHSMVRVVQARFSNNTAQWDGVTEKIQASGAGWKALLIGPQHGTIGALTLVVFIEDPNEVPMYSDAGGLQAVAKISGTTFTPIPPSELFKDEERNANAVDIALDALTTKPTSTPAAGGKP